MKFCKVCLALILASGFVHAGKNKGLSIPKSVTNVGKDILNKVNVSGDDIKGVVQDVTGSQDVQDMVGQVQDAAMEMIEPEL